MGVGSSYFNTPNGTSPHWGYWYNWSQASVGFRNNRSLGHRFSAFSFMSRLSFDAECAVTAPPAVAATGRAIPTSDGDNTLGGISDALSAPRLSISRVCRDGQRKSKNQG